MKSVNSQQVLHLLWDPLKKEKKIDYYHECDNCYNKNHKKAGNDTWPLYVIVIEKKYSIIISSLFSQCLSVNHGSTVLPSITTAFLKQD